MAKQHKRRHTSSQRHPTLHKPRGFFQDRVERVSPNHFGLVCFDCHKDYSQWMFADFFGNFLIPPQRLDHKRPALDAAVQQLRQTAHDHDIKDLLIVIERTGRYHRLVQRTFAAAHYDIRIVHPFTTKQFRQVSDPDDKTDNRDLSAIHRAAINGFALAEPQRDAFWTEFLRLARFRRSLIHKNAKLRCQIHNHLDAYLPGFADAFENFWTNHCPGLSPSTSCPPSRSPTPASKA